MEYSIKSKPGALKIKIHQLDEAQQEVLDSISACAHGECSCPTSQYEKLEFIQILPEADGLSIELKAKPGETISRAEIEKCLQFTAEQVGKS